MDNLLDTGILILAVRDSRAFRAIDAVLDLFGIGFQPMISIVSQGEILAQAKKWNWGTAKLASLQSLLSRVAILPIDQVSIAERYAELEAENEKRGLNIGQNDLWIAATAIEYDLTLLTTDADFERCPKPLRYIRFDQRTGTLLSSRPAEGDA